MRKSERRRLRNQVARGRARTAVKKARLVIQDGEADAAREAVRVACSTLDKAASKGILHRNNAARRKARLMRRLNQALQNQS